MGGIAGWLRGLRAGGQHTARADDERVFDSEQRVELEHDADIALFANLTKPQLIGLLHAMGNYVDRIELTEHSLRRLVPAEFSEHQAAEFVQQLRSSMCRQPPVDLSGCPQALQAHSELLRLWRADDANTELVEGEPVFDDEERERLLRTKYIRDHAHIGRKGLVALLRAVARYSSSAPAGTRWTNGSEGEFRMVHAHRAILAFPRRRFTGEEYAAEVRRDPPASYSLGRPPARPAEPDPPAGGGCEFALAMFRSLGQRPGNLLFSPFSIRTALSMARAGARAGTAAQLNALPGVSPVNESADIVLAAMTQRHGAGGRTCRLSVVNSLWCQDGEALQAGFADLIERQYSGAVSLVDFRGAVEHARGAINRWVEARTAQVIGELIPANTLDAQTRLVLVNAICFTGIWELRFPRMATREEPFFLESGRTVHAPLMYQKAVAWYARGPGYQAVDLAYEGHGLSMLVIVPDRKDGLRDLEQGTSARMFGVARGLMSLCQVELFLPRFAIAWGTVDLRGSLVNLGLTLPFDPSKADFSGINGRRPPSEAALFISAVLHKACIEVNEEGTEAAAATAATMSLIGSVGPLPLPRVPVVRADHPFLFAIREPRYGGILFLGRMVDPTQKH